MLILILGLIILSFIESAWLPLSIVVIVLIIRSFIVPEKFNYFLAFGFGLLIAILTNQTIGVLSLIFLILVKIIHMIRISQISSSWVFILPMSFVLLIVFSFIQNFVGNTSFNLKFIVIQIILSIPIYVILRFWEERFVPKKEVRLKVRS